MLLTANTVSIVKNQSTESDPALLISIPVFVFVTKPIRQQPHFTFILHCFKIVYVNNLSKREGFFNTMDELKIKSLNYHSKKPAGKLTISSSKPCETQEDLSLAYSPGVAYPCLEIKNEPLESYTYTSRGNTVAVITDASAVLGLGDIGAEASMPVMEGKAVLLKKFADINGVPLSIKNHSGVDDIIHIISSLEANFGAINLEDIKAPECFDIEKKLIEELDIPVFHDDQHGTAIISLAGIIGSLDIVGKKLKDLRIVINGAGAAGLASAKLYICAGASPENIIILDSKGVIRKGRKEKMNEHKEEFIIDTEKRTLDDALEGADVFVGVSTANILEQKMIESMNRDPIIFALANPEPEIMPQDAKKYGARIVATGRSDFPNQVNNILGFPGIFRAALDTRAVTINQQMKLAAAEALHQLALKPIPEDIQKMFKTIYPEDSAKGVFKKESPLSENYIIPKPFDPRIVPTVAKHVAAKAMATDTARIPIEDLDEYEKEVAKRIMV